MTLIGPNGAGKTTLLRSIIGVQKQVHEGPDRLQRGSDRQAHLRQAGELKESALVPEGRRVLPEMSVYENLLLGAYSRRDRGRLDDSLKAVMNLFPLLEERRDQLAGTLSGGQQQMLVLGRAMMAKPNLLMLDEPSLGLAPLMVREVFHLIRRLHETEGLTILLVEQNARMALTVASRGYLLEAGNLALEGTTEMLQGDAKVREVYLGA